MTDKRRKQIADEIDKILSKVSDDKKKNNPAAALMIMINFTLGAMWADKHPNWIRVEDELPKIGKDVLVLRKDGEMQVAHQYNEEIARWWSVDGFPLNNNITHWMPLPKKGGEE